MRIRSAIAAFAFIALSSSLAAADEVTKEAEARFQEGLELAKGGKYEEARAKFLQSLALSKSPKTLLNLTIAEKNSGHPSDALRHLRAYFREPGANQQKIGDLKKELFPELYAQSAHLKIEAPLGAAVTVDGEPVDRLDEEYDVAPGAHVIAALSGGKRETKNVSVQKGALETVKLTMPADPPTVATPLATPLTSVPPPPVAPTQGFWTTRRWIGLGVAGVGLVGGVVGFAVSKSAASSAEDGRAALRSDLAGRGGCTVTSADCVKLDALADDRVSANDRAVGFAVAGGALVAVGSVLVLLPETKKTDGAEAKNAGPSVHVAPTLGGASLFGTF